MAKNISLLGADYPDVPAVQLPQTGGGTATFYDLEVTDGDPTLAWGQRSKVGTINETDLHVTMPLNPASASDNNPTLAFGSQSKVGTANGIDLHVTMPANPAINFIDGGTVTTDLNNLVTSGFYWISAAPQHSPEGFAFLIVAHVGNGNVLQMLIRPTKIYVRRNAGTWEDWKSVTLS